MQSATFNDIRVSDNFSWFVKQSIRKTANPNTWVRENAVPGDNQVGEGQTPITPDLN